MFCPKCGKPVPEASRFCRHCGAETKGGNSGSANESDLRTRNTRPSTSNAANSEANSAADCTANNAANSATYNGGTQIKGRYAAFSLRGQRAAGSERYGSGSTQRSPSNSSAASAKNEPGSVAARIVLGIISVTLFLPALFLVNSGIAAHGFISPWLSLGEKLGVEMEVDGEYAVQMAVAALMYGAMIVSFAGSAVTGVICAMTRKFQIALSAFVVVGLVVLVAVLVMFVPMVPSQYLALLLIPVILCIVPLALAGTLGYLSRCPARVG